MNMAEKYIFQFIFHTENRFENSKQYYLVVGKAGAC